MTLDRRTVFDCQGCAVRMVGRRPSGAVMVEYLAPRTHRPTATWRECWPHELRAPHVGIGHIKSLAVVLPLVRLAFDDAPTLDARGLEVPASPPAAKAMIEGAGPIEPAPEPWWTKL